MNRKEGVINPVPSANSSSNKDVKMEKKYTFYRKPPVTKKVPEVKQTKTSMKRLLIANPLLRYEQEGFIPQKLDKPSTEIVDVQPRKLHTISKETNPKTSNVIVKSKVRLNSIITSNSSDNRNNVSIASSCNKLSGDFTNVHISSSTPFNGKTAPVKKQSGIRRSISAEHFNRKKVNLKPAHTKPPSKSIMSHSVDSINDLPTVIMDYHQISPIPERSRETSFVFKTPSAYERRSIMNTSSSVAANRRSVYRQVTPLPSLQDLQKRLNDWLVKRGKNIASFQNLTRFKPVEPIDEENKENIEGDGNVDLGSYEDLCIPQTIVDNENKSTNIDMASLAKAALLDLQKLAQNGFPLNQCEAWLGLIKEKYAELSDTPEYWECRAIIEESRGNIGSAVEYYKTAIVQGAEVTQVDKSLDVLLQKFSLLDINSECVEVKSMTQERARIIQDARNVFKSSIIKFAVQQKKLKGEEKKLVATPVRRSTRLSRSTYISTPGVKMCSSLRELDSPDRNQLSFQRNKALD